MCRTWQRAPLLGWWDGSHPTSAHCHRFRRISAPVRSAATAVLGPQYCMAQQHRDAWCNKKSCRQCQQAGRQAAKGGCTPAHITSSRLADFAQRQQGPWILHLSLHTESAAASGHGTRFCSTDIDTASSAGGCQHGQLFSATPALSPVPGCGDCQPAHRHFVAAEEQYGHEDVGDHLCHDILNFGNLGPNTKRKQHLQAQGDRSQRLLLCFAPGRAGAKLTSQMIRKPELSWVRLAEMGVWRRRSQSSALPTPVPMA